MDSLSLLKRKGSMQPYSKPLRLKVVAISEAREYRPGSKMLCIGLADKDDAIRAVCFDEAKFRLLKEGSGVLLTNFSLKNGEITIGAGTKVYCTSPPEISQNVAAEARELIFPKEPQVIAINGAKKSPKGKTVSIRGKIVSDGAVTSASIKGQQVDVKTIEVEDGRDRVKVSLWRNLAASSTKPGDFVKITHVYATNNAFYNEVILASTNHTTIDVIEPELEETELEILGCNIQELSTDLVTLEKVFTVGNEVLIAKHSLEEFPENLPLKMKVQAINNKIMAIL